jgi:NAD-dependent deacetylase
MKKITVLSGAGISAESGIKTFRDAGGLWEGHDVMEVASPEGWRNNQELVLEFYNERRKELKKVNPNPGHTALVDLESLFNVTIITQNVDNLHERAGSSKVIHLHGELNKVRSTAYPQLIYDWDDNLHLDDKCEKGHQLRPHIVWFGEAVPMMEPAAEAVLRSDIFIIIGTSLQVYPAAGLSMYCNDSCHIYYVDPKPQLNFELIRNKNLKVIEGKGSIKVPELVQDLIQKRDLK